MGPRKLAITRARHTYLPADLFPSRLESLNIGRNSSQPACLAEMTPLRGFLYSIAEDHEDAILDLPNGLAYRTAGA